MMFETALALLLRREGDYADVPGDRGGPTRYGITETVAHRHGYRGDMRDLPLALAGSIYRHDYWDLLSLDRVPDRTAVAMFDCAVNMGQTTAAIYLQRSLNAVGPSYVDIDGRVGPLTLAALWYLAAHSGNADAIIATSINALRVHHYIDIAATDPSQRKFVAGWVNRVANLDAQ